MCYYLCDMCAKEHVDLPDACVLCFECDSPFKKTINDSQNPLDVCEHFKMGFRLEGGETWQQ